MTTKRQTVSKILFALSTPLILLALLCVAIPIIGTHNGLYYEWEDLFALSVFYAVFALSAVTLIGVGIWLRGWKEARFGKIALVALFGFSAIGITVGLLVDEKAEPVSHSERP
jgi:hypothetical protein